MRNRLFECAARISGDKKPINSDTAIRPADCRGKGCNGWLQ